MSRTVFTTQRRIEFADTDLGGIVHFARFLIFMETAEHEFLRSLGTEVHVRDGDRTISWPRVKTACTYHRPARFGDELDIQVGIGRRGSKSMTYVFRFLRGEELLAEGEMTSVCCVMGEPGGMRAIEIPEALAAKFDELVAGR